MKSSYRQAVESVIAQAAKLDEIKRLHAQSLEKAKNLEAAVEYNTQTLAAYEARVTELEGDFLIPFKTPDNSLEG